MSLSQYVAFLGVSLLQEVSSADVSADYFIDDLRGLLLATVSHKDRARARPQ